MENIFLPIYVGIKGRRRIKSESLGGNSAVVFRVKLNSNSHVWLSPWQTA